MKKKKFAIFLIIVVVLIGTVVGFYIFKANYRETVSSKIEHLMFDKKNKTPRFVLILPIKNKEKTEVKIEEAPEPVVAGVSTDIKAALSKIPQLSALTQNEKPVPMRIIDRNSELLSKDNIPAVSKSGEKPWIYYSKAVDVLPNFYKVIVIFNDLGVNKDVMNLLPNGLPENVSFSFSPYALEVAQKIKQSRLGGHETYIDLLLPPKDFQTADHGPLAISLTDTLEINLSKLKRIVSINAPIGGLIFNDGMLDVDSKDRLNSFLNQIKDMGLLVVDGTTENLLNKVPLQGLPLQKVNVFIDDTMMKKEIKQKLLDAESVAEKQGYVIVLAAPKPIIILAINDWLKTFSPQYKDDGTVNFAPEKPFALVPLSAVVAE